MGGNGKINKWGKNIADENKCLKVKLMSLQKLPCYN